jgi:DNA-binding MarR family transcriptional regulator
MQHLSSSILINDKLLVTARLLEKAGNLLFGHFGLTTGAYEILLHIHAGANTTAALAGLLQSSLANITHKTKLLESQGYLERTVSDTDKRIWHFSLTPEGERVFGAIRMLYEKATDALYGRFSEKEKKQFLLFVDAVESHLKAIVENQKHVEKFVATSSPRTR